MDHLPQLKDASNSYPSVPFLGVTFSNNVPFLDFPARQGWDKNGLEQGDFQQGHDERGTASFLQTWLYFGLLFELSIAGHCDPPKRGGFIRNQGPLQVVTSDGLDQFIAKCVKRIASSSSKKRGETLERLNAALNCARLVTEMLWVLQERHDEKCPLPIEVIISIMVLGCSIDIALREADIMAPSRRWRLSELAKGTMQRQGWCRRDVSLADAYLSELSMYCAMHLRRNTTGQSHKRCTEHACDANQIDDSNYETRHRTPDCRCSFWGADSAELQQIIAQGRIPYIELKQNAKANQGQFSTLAPSLKSLSNSIVEGPHNRLVIFSHVWSDGLGNPHRNALPLCQLQYFYDMLSDSPWNSVVVGGQMMDDKYKNKRIENSHTFPPKSWSKWGRKQFNSPIKIWIDTLCVPLEPKAKKTAIGMLKRYYSLASMAVVLDRELSQIPHKSYSESELLLRIGLSGWMRRCWTMQEAIIAGGSLCVRFADGWFKLPEVVAFLRQKNSISPYLMNEDQQRTINTMRTRLECLCLPFKACIYVAAGPQMLCELLTRLICVKAPKKAWESARPKEVATPFTASERLFEDAKGFFAVITDLCHGLPPKDPERTKARIRRVVLAWQGLSYRNTSKSPDRFINFAFACAKREADFDVMRDVLGQHSSDRLRLWFQAQGDLPAGLMFVKGPRMYQQGYRWAPNDVYPAVIGDGAPATVTKRGDRSGVPEGSLRLQKPGLTLSGSLSPGMKAIEVIGNGNAAEYSVDLDWGSSPDGAEALKTGSNLALVLCKPPLPGTSTSAALLANVVRRGDTFVGEFCCGAQVNMARTGDRRGGEKKGSMTGQQLAGDQIWVVT